MTSIESWAESQRRPYLRRGGFDFGDDANLREGVSSVREVFLWCDFRG